VVDISRQLENPVLGREGVDNSVGILVTANDANPGAGFVGLRLDPAAK
jgi:hypothetical protein